jgi:hypothetical protein
MAGRGLTLGPSAPPLRAQRPVDLRRPGGGHHPRRHPHRWGPSDRPHRRPLHRDRPPRHARVPVALPRRAAAGPHARRRRRRRRPVVGRPPHRRADHPGSAPRRRPAASNGVGARQQPPVRGRREPRLGVGGRRGRRRHGARAPVAGVRRRCPGRRRRPPPFRRPGRRQRGVGLLPRVGRPDRHQRRHARRRRNGLPRARAWPGGHPRAVPLAHHRRRPPAGSHRRRQPHRRAAGLDVGGARLPGRRQPGPPHSPHQPGEPRRRLAPRLGRQRVHHPASPPPRTPATTSS